MYPLVGDYCEGGGKVCVCVCVCVCGYGYVYELVWHSNSVDHFKMCINHSSETDCGGSI